MVASAPQPPLPGPPDDPTWWLLDGRVGWRGARYDAVEGGPSGALRLGARPDSGRRLVEASGSLGGLVPPLGVAVDARGEIYLLDRPAAALRRFDRCRCRFETTP